MSITVDYEPVAAPTFALAQASAGRTVVYECLTRSPDRILCTCGKAFTFQRGAFARKPDAFVHAEEEHPHEVKERANG